MKTVVVLCSAIACASLPALGQGQFLFNTDDVAAGNLLKFELNGMPATGNDLFLAVAAGPDAQHLIGPLLPLLAVNGTGAGAGYAYPRSATYTVPGMTAGQSATVAYNFFQGKNLAAAYLMTGWRLASSVVLTEPPVQPNEVSIGTHTLTFVPEPTTWTLGVVGLGLLLVLRKLKNDETSNCPVRLNRIGKAAEPLIWADLR